MRASLFLVIKRSVIREVDGGVELSCGHIKKIRYGEVRKTTCNWCYEESRNTGQGVFQPLYDLMHALDILDDHYTLPELPGKIRTLKEVEKEAVLNAMLVCKGNKAAAARALGCNTKTMFSKWKKYNPDG